MVNLHFLWTKLFVRSVRAHFFSLVTQVDSYPSLTSQVCHLKMDARASRSNTGTLKDAYSRQDLMHIISSPSKMENALTQAIKVITNRKTRMPDLNDLDVTISM